MDWVAPPPWNTHLNVVSTLISGVAGIGHIILGVSLVMILLDIKKSVD